MNKAQNSAYCAYGYRCVGENRHSTQFSVPITQCDGYSVCGWWCAVVYRGCTSTQWGLADPLPEDGCYTWETRSELWCFCSSSGCNGVKLGKSTKDNDKLKVKRQECPER